MRYWDPEDRIRDERWPEQSRIARGTSPRDYSVPTQYFQRPQGPRHSDPISESPTDSYVTLKSFATSSPKAPSLEAHTLRDDYFLEPQGPQNIESPVCLCALCGSVRDLPQSLSFLRPGGEGFGACYRRCVRVLGLLGSCSTPRDMQELLRLFHQWLLREASGH
jgi:hypothetical protein